MRRRSFEQRRWGSGKTEAKVRDKGRDLYEASFGPRDAAIPCVPVGRLAGGATRRRSEALRPHSAGDAENSAHNLQTVVKRTEPPGTAESFTELRSEGLVAAGYCEIALAANVDGDNLRDWLER